MKIKHVLRIIAFLFVSACLLIGCASSGKDTKAAFPTEFDALDTQEIISNEKYSLSWDQDKACVLLRQKETDKVWSSIPYDFYLTEAEHEDMNSPISIQYIDHVSMVCVTDKGYTDCVQKKHFSAKTTEDGLEVIYYFDEADISVPVRYVLREESLAVTVDFKNATEGANKLLSVSVAPFLCSAENRNEDSYLVVPSGCGALMYTDERAEGIRTWSGEIYGEDVSRLLPENLLEEEAVRLPIFGVKDGADGLLAIVEEGDEAAYITANAGDAGSGYSNAYVTFYARGYDISEAQTSWAMSDVYHGADFIDEKQTTIGFYPLSADEADYMGMVSRYQEYLQKNGFLQSENAEEKPYALYFSGGAKVEELVLGVPVKKTRALTTFQQVQEILGEVVEASGATPAVQLQGFGASGLDAGKVAGGFTFASVLGSDDDRLALEEYCSEKKMSLFTDFDLIYFRSGGKGISKLLNAAKSASSHKVQIYLKDKALWHYNDEEEGAYLVARKKLLPLAEKLQKTVEKKNISGVSLSTLGYTAYSDYSDAAYSSRGNIASDVQKILRIVKQNERKAATESANIYAAVYSDSILKTTITDGEYLALDASVPLYQMILKGYVALYSTPINITENPEKELALAISSGTAPGFSLVGEYDIYFSTTEHKALHASDYEGNKSNLLQMVEETKNYYEAVCGQRITAYELLPDTVTKTVFSNGVIVYVNHNDKAVQTPLGELGAYGFVYTSEEK